MKKNKLFLSKIFLYLELLLIIYSSGSVSVIVYPNIANCLKYLILLIPLPLIAQIKIERKLYQKIKLFFEFVLIYWGIYIIFHPQSVVTIIFLCSKIIIFTLLMIFCMDNKIDIQLVIYRLVVFLAVITLFFYISINFYGMFKENALETMGVWDNYFYLFYNRTDEIVTKYLFGNTFYRLNGLFWEPGVYQIFLIYSLFFYLFIKRQKHFIPLFIISLSIFLTFSTTGYLMFILFLVIYIVTRIKENYFKIIFFQLLFLLFISLTVILLMIKNNQGEKGSYNSLTIRLYDMFIALKLFIQKPIFGYGFEAQDVFMELQGFDRGCSNGIASCLYITGLWGIIFNFYPFILKKDKTLILYLYLIFYFISNMTEPFILQPFMTLILVFVYVNKLLSGVYINE